ncbi:peptide/nickel transport system substrate-binding protein [Micromonospora pallida]|uniref:Peptide/nickel transport system substrate-binding protein n=1 Tax=Micromonospora pallida TaxID=145854 RepID=A0A1C6SY78_9ACTN|nr:ABC transporter substrate-binding protein [Micromonospora pallida]SCL34448.1 peptide/nickel transport system substrate-binding protein [Micromonospora pallida]
MKKTVKGRWRLAVALGVAATLGVSGCSLNEGNSSSSGSSSDASVLRIGTTTDVSNFNPLQSLSKTDSWILNAMYPHLLRIDESAKKSPELAKEYRYEDGGKTAVFVLRDDFKWTDGKPVVADDVKFSAEQIMKYKLGNVAAKLTWVESIEAPDATTVKFHLSQPYAPFAEGVGFWMSVVPKHVFEKAGDLSKFANDSNWVGAGPFVLESMTKGQRYVMKRNENYPLAPDGKAAVSQVEYRVYPDVNTMMLALRNGDIDLMGTPVPVSAAKTFAGDSKIKMEKVGALGFAHLTYNMKNKQLADQAVRQALSMSVDTKSIISAVLQGDAQEMVGPISPIFADYDNTEIQPYPFDPAGAKAKLTAAGYKDGNGDGFFDELAFGVACDQSNANITRVVQLFRESAAKAGIKLENECVERNTFLSRTKSGEYDIDASQWGVFDNPMDQLRSTYLSSNPGGINYNLLESPELDKLINDAAGTTDPEAFKTKIKNIDKVVHEQAYLTPLYVENFQFAYNADKFTGFAPSPSDLLGMVTAYSLAQVKPAK